MSRYFVCAHISKDVEIDIYAAGCDGKRSCVLDSACYFRNDTLAGLLEDIGNSYGLEIDDVWIPGDEGSGLYFGYNRIENESGDEPSERETVEWKAGRLSLYLADYSFRIELIETTPVTVERFRAENIKFHD